MLSSWLFVIRWISLGYAGEMVGGFLSVGGSAKLALSFAINLRERVRAVSKSSKLSFAPTCQNLDNFTGYIFSPL